MSVAIPGPKTHALGRSLAAVESRGVTYLGDRFPVFLDAASGARVTDVDGNTYLDFTAAFGVAGIGHSNPAVVRAIAEQASRLMHAMGDVHPAAVRVKLLERLAHLAPGDLSKSYLCSTGSEAVEAALKTAMLSTGKAGVIAFYGAYHGLSLGALAVCGFERFRKPFASATTQRAVFFEYPRAADESGDNPTRTMTAIDRRASSGDIGALIVEPIQGRAGVVVPPHGFLAALRRLCNERGIVLIFDEVYTGFGRTGTMFAAQYEDVVPDIMCLGKAIANGFPISAAIAKPNVMDAWPPSAGEALHTSTFLGNPMGCAAALATIAQIERFDLPERARQLGGRLHSRLEKLRASGAAIDLRGRGLMWGLDLRTAKAATDLVTRALGEGLLLLQAGEHGNVISITPPLTISEEELDRGLNVIESLLLQSATR